MKCLHFYCSFFYNKCAIMQIGRQAYFVTQHLSVENIQTKKESLVRAAQIADQSFPRLGPVMHG